MREYASDAPDRQYVYLALAALSVGAAWLLHAGLKAWSLEPWWWVEVPSVLGFYGVFFWLYDRTAWKIASRVPNLNGTWVGKVESSFGDQTRKSCVVHIEQTWTRLLVSLQTDQSRSTSTMAALYVTPSQGKGLRYEFLSEPVPLVPESMHAHRGCCHLELSSNQRKLDGTYYTGRDRGNTGLLHLSFLSRDRLDYAKAITEVSK